MPTLADDNPDRRLVEQAAGGDRGAFRRIVERHAEDVTRAVVALLGPGPDADDVVQETFLKFFETLERYRADAPLAAYLKRIAVNRALDVLRKRRRTRARFSEPRPALDPADVGRADDALEADERTTLVRRAVEALPVKQRAVVVLRLVEGYSTEETARMLGVPYGTVLSRLSRALDRLRTRLGPYIDTDHP